jgi:hypothetical protein
MEHVLAYVVQCEFITYADETASSVKKKIINEDMDGCLKTSTIS